MFAYKLISMILVPFFFILYDFPLQTLYEEVIPAFDVMGKKSFFLGEVGNGAKMKLVVNMVMGR